MAESLRGNLGLKSSPLAPTACKLSTQYLVLDHMTNHYNKIAKARSVIDTKPPKSLTTSQKMRDRRNRELHFTSPQLPKSLSRSQSDLHTYQDILGESSEFEEKEDDEPEDEDSRLVHSIMKATLFGQPHASNKATYGTSSMHDPSNLNGSMLYNQAGDTTLGKISRPASARSAQSLRSARSGSYTARVPVKTHDPSKVTYQGDLLDKRPHLFTEPERAFTPRTLKVNHESKLKNSKWYNPPRRSSSQSRASDVKENSVPKTPTKRNKPEVSPSQNVSQQELRDPPETAHLSESMLMDITLRSRDEQRLSGANSLVPPLAISMDQDHMNWLQEQATKAEVRARSSSKLKSSLHSDDEIQGQQTKETHLKDAIKTEKTNKLPSVKSVTSQHSIASWISQRLQEEDEEQKYLNFAKEVTDDVRSRGICADSVLHRVFENHIERRKHDLDEERMRKVIKDLKRNLGIPEFVPPAVTSFSKRKGSHSSSHLGETGLDESMTLSAFNDETFSLPAHTLPSHLETGSTLDSTSTIKFGKTGDLMSTVDSVPDEKDENSFEKEDDNGLSATQVLKEYQFDLTMKDTMRETMSNGDMPLNSSQQLSRMERPATGERRMVEDEDRMSVSSSTHKALVSSVGNHSRTKRREMLKKAHDVDISSVTSQPSSPGIHDGGYIDSSLATHEMSNENEDTSLKSSLSSSRPVAKARSSKSGAAIAMLNEPTVKLLNSQDDLPASESISHSNTAEVHQESDDKTDNEYEEDYEEFVDDGNDADVDDEHGISTHRTTDDDF